MLDWQEVLGGLSPEQIKTGWDKWDSEFPPNSLQFRTACKTEITKELHKEYKVLPRPPRNPLVASAALRAMRAAL